MVRISLNLVAPCSGRGIARRCVLSQQPNLNSLLERFSFSLTLLKIFWAFGKMRVLYSGRGGCRQKRLALYIK